MKKLLYLTLFLSILIFCLTIKENELKNKSNLKHTEKVKQTDEELTKDIFLTKPEKCASAADLKKEVQDSLIKTKDQKEKRFLRGEKSELWWVKNWGYGDSAYLFDFVSPVLRDIFIKDAKEIYASFKEIDNKKDGNYEDPFDYANFITKDMSENEKNKLLNNLKLINSNYDKDVFDASINAVQLHNGLKNFKWYTAGGSSDYAKEFILKYDADGDGRINPRELILGAIDYNKSNYGNPKINHIFYPTIGKLDVMFRFFDCNDDGYINAEEVWKNIQNLKRGEGEKRYDIFGLNKTLRLRSVNDFILKSHETRNGLLNREEFISGFLFGFWNRQLERTAILEDDSRSLIALRWEEGTKDKAFIKSLAQ